MINRQWEKGVKEVFFLEIYYYRTTRYNVQKFNKNYGSARLAHQMTRRVVLLISIGSCMLSGGVRARCHQSNSRSLAPANRQDYASDTAFAFRHRWRLITWMATLATTTRTCKNKFIKYVSTVSRTINLKA